MDLFRVVNCVAASPRAAMVGATSIDLVRALIASSTGDSTNARAVRHETLLARIPRVRSPALERPRLGSGPDCGGPQHVPTAGVALLARSGASLEQIIITRRLEAAYEQPSHATARHKTTAAVAAEWGFDDPAHFSRRFKDTFGMTAGERRELATPRS